MNISDKRARIVLLLRRAGRLEPEDATVPRLSPVVPRSLSRKGKDLEETADERRSVL